MADTLSRRSFIRNTGLLTAAGTMLPVFGNAVSTKKHSTSPNDKLVIGLIGCGGMGAANMRTLMQYDDVAIAAVCDVDDNRMPGDIKEVEKKYGKKPDVYKDYRKMLDRKDIDAVIVGTPDHWHALNLIHACQAGKDAYCEKPISHNIVEAQMMMHAVEKYKRIVQVGTWQRSTQQFVDAINLVRSGKLGKITNCRAWIADTTRVGRQKPTSAPNGFDYDMWVGPANMVPFQTNNNHWNWRWFLNTGSGLSGDWGVHMMDIALLGMSKDTNLVMPKSVSAYGGLWALTNDDRTAPDTTEAIYHFENPDFVLHWSVLRDHPNKPGHCTEFVAADGRTLRVCRDGIWLLDPDGKEMPLEKGPEPKSHWRDWVDCVKTRTQPVANLHSVGQTTMICHLANAAMWAGTTVEWDAAKLDIKGKAGKSTGAYTRKYRKGYSLPVV